MLTQRERRLFDHLSAEFSRVGIAPSIREMKRNLRVCAETIHEDLQALEGIGMIRRLPGRARAIEVTSTAYFRFNDATKKLERWA